MTAIELIEDTVKYYSENVNRRANDNCEGTCYYKMSNGNKCAVGRCLKPSILNIIEENDRALGAYSSLLSELNLLKNDSNKIIKKKYLPTDISNEETFYLFYKLQKLHDDNVNWSEEGLSEIGKRVVNNLKKFYK